jgi:hypothetical protein
MLMNGIFTEAGTLVQSEDAADGASSRSHGSADNRADRTGCPVALGGAMFGTSDQTLSLGSERHSRERGREHKRV